MYVCRNTVHPKGARRSVVLRAWVFGTLWPTTPSYSRLHCMHQVLLLFVCTVCLSSTYLWKGRLLSCLIHMTSLHSTVILDKMGAATLSHLRLAGSFTMPVAHWAHYHHTADVPTPEGVGLKQSQTVAHPWPLHKGDWRWGIMTVIDSLRGWNFA